MGNSDCPLIQALIKFKEANPVSFHVPGHKHGVLSGLPLELRAALQYDFTELAGLDDLHEPNGVIEEAQEKLSTFYGSDRSFFLVNGSTVGNLAMVYATCRKGDTVIVQRNAHKSVFHAIELTGANPVFVSPVWDKITKTAGAVSLVQIGMALEENTDVKAVILTYPSYYGTTGTDMEEIIRLCHIYKIPVLVDEAHGAHFVVGEPFPRSALEMGADVVVHSAHKTLPAMTMASFLHIRSNLVSYERVARYLQMLQSSSPSYMLMASLDDARAYAESYNEEDKRLFMKRRATFIERLKMIPRLQTCETDDPLKLIIRVEGYSGFDIQKRLEEKGVYGEFADAYQVLFVMPLLKVESTYPFEETIQKIESAITCLDESCRMITTVEVPPINGGVSYLIHTAEEIEQVGTVWVSYEESVGRVAAASIIPYPPGIPLLIAGERVTEEHIQSLRVLVNMGAKFQGEIRMNEQQIVVVK
ncbi:aminotransferase class I/II-fold pyridoxal phosphate-dependent enzyme [Sporosarcina limicola]|uniref:Arginine/lysine/ornithine decarboxylase n=1 Tax=Sporosarcina limicola TaxID=34101 RepID=A0A927MLL8_9BACL|nr:aminotransferase class I/II-fold pyridoxal phosphate-dependent enzyme [Sporosarcina limicola]MBE1556206.1 arginine/lysine/ornithine decarboxylase [Sporosarcina limicola]